MPYILLERNANKLLLLHERVHPADIKLNIQAIKIIKAMPTSWIKCW
jgi:hypothetical protein